MDIQAGIARPAPESSRTVPEGNDGGEPAAEDQVGIYFRQITEYPLLARAEERALAEEFSRTRARLRELLFGSALCQERMVRLFGLSTDLLGAAHVSLV